ncbi:MAG: hypothetical protein DME49_13835 [Verrucomicrobia bacterium]|nr:MAG: hypothetical protein DME49_13835 [Verrucomicrobiota bacterium]
MSRGNSCWISSRSSGIASTRYSCSDRREKGNDSRVTVQDHVARPTAATASQTSPPSANCRRAHQTLP